MLPQRRPAWLFLVSHKAGMDAAELSASHQQTKRYRHPAISSARKSPKSDHRRRYGFR